MSNTAPLRFPSQDGRSPRQRQERAMAARQLEIADVYLGAVEALDLGDRDLGRRLRGIRGELAATLARLNPVS